MKENRKRRKLGGQEELPFEPVGWGGRRRGAGRKKSKSSGVSHGKREAFRESEPLLVTMKLKEGLPSLRKKESFLVLVDVFGKARREGFRIVHFSVQGNHVHLLVEAAGPEALSRGMVGLAVRMSRRLNRAWGRSGSVFADRYHSRVLRSPTVVRNALLYVLANGRKHPGGPPRGRPDPRSSAPLFDGWKEMEPYDLDPAGPVVAARSWLLRTGWRRGGGLLSLFDEPAKQPRPRERKRG